MSALHFRRLQRRPRGLKSTGNPVFAVPASLLGVPSLSLPVLKIGELPLGLQLMGFINEDASMFAAASEVLALFASAVA